MHYIIYGPEGSGKGTQAEKLSDKLKLPVFTAGDLVREAAQKDAGETGVACRRALSTGTYVADSTMCKLLAGLLTGKDAQKGFILDGFPRTQNQAEFLWNTVSRMHKKINKVIYLFLSDKESLKRLLARKRKLFAGSSQSHDSRDRILKRLTAYRAAEKELISFFEKKKILLRINGEKSREDVFADIIADLGIN